MANNLKRKYDAKHLALNALVENYKDWNNRDFVKHISHLEKQIDALKAEITRLEDKLLNKDKELQKPTLPTFKKTWKIPNKIHYILLAQQKPMQLPALLAELHRVDKGFMLYEYPKVLLATHLGRQTKAGRFKRLKLAGTPGYYYCLPEWMDEQGALKPEYQAQMSYF